ncbi:endonuclease [Tenacibaculum sp. IB213877]|uniref:endonuclease n=1 Tax=Tenacibaculum sp. IB213877 TaxID=3097351 RepID=UPI002A5A3DAA|nr:endonuclease [Tenacibaculum sp. IB213877]MDY0780424.1 endonuclease [Tenacibaculum sp. IB213877]
MKHLLTLASVAILCISCGGSEDVIKEPVDNVEAKNDIYQVEKNKTLEVSNFLSNDIYTTGSVQVSVQQTSSNNATITKSGDKYTYTPAIDFVGTDTFEYTLCSTIATNSCSTAVITIEVYEPSSNTSNYNIPAELLEYYNGVNFELTSTSLKDELAAKIIATHTTNLSYTPGVWDVLKQSDLDPTDNNKVVLIYGYNDSDGNYVTDRTRSKNANGGNAGTDWNREHTYPKALGNPNLGTSGPGADAHHLRPSDVTFNSQRSNKKFAQGSGNAGDSSGGWYPGDEWKGDVARMMMYMYLRYGNQCLPKNVAIGTTVNSDDNMIALLLEWNIEDPVSEFEMTRNTIVENAQGNRNPFIDNPYLATVIWGGNDAENTWE